MMLAEFREYFHGPLIGNCGYDAGTADAAIADGSADLIAIGRPFIANPDLVERYRNGWPLAEAVSGRKDHIPKGVVVMRKQTAAISGPSR